MIQILFYCISVILLTFASCKSTKNPDYYPKCSDVVPINKTLNIDIGTESFQNDVQIWSRDSMDVSYLVMDSVQYNSLMTSIGNLTNFSELPYSIVVYSNNSITTSGSLTLYDIIGISYYFLKSGKLYHRFFKKQGDGFDLIDNLSVEVKYIASNDIFRIIGAYFNPDQYKFVSWMSFFSSSNQSYKLSHPKHKLTKRLSNTGLQRVDNQDKLH